MPLAIQTVLCNVLCVPKTEGSSLEAASEQLFDHSTKIEFFMLNNKSSSFNRREAWYYI